MSVMPQAVALHVGRAEKAVRTGSVATAIRHLESGLVEGAGSLGDETQTRTAYAKLMKMTRHTCGPDAAPQLLRHLIDHADLEPDAATVHLAVVDKIYRGDRGHALSMLRELRQEGAELSSGSFDAVIQAAGRARDRASAMAAYRLLRRAQLSPTIYTLNALMNVLARAGTPEEAVALLRRAEAGGARWPGAPPDAWTWSAAMSGAAQQGEHRLVRTLFYELLR